MKNMIYCLIPALFSLTPLSYSFAAEDTAPETTPIAAPAPSPSPVPGPKMYQHKPYAGKFCDMCHEQDASGKVIPNKFVDQQPALCYQCHKKVPGSVVHPALKKGTCTSMCHNPHESPVRPLLKEKVIDLCVECHDAPGVDSAVKHSAVDMLKSCVRCHNPHAASLPKLLRDETPKLCIYCHKDIGEGINDPKMHVHPAIDDAGCEGCHQPHGSKNGKLLKKPLNDLCFTCHAKKKFGDGHPINGHPLTLAQDPLFPEKPFTCVSCHKPHFSRNVRLQRYRFTKGETPYDGTICSVCHWQKLLPPPAPPHPKWNE